MTKIIKGTDLRFAVTMTAGGFTMEDDDWSVSFVIGGVEVASKAKADAILNGSQYVVTCGTGGWPCGALFAVCTALIPDATQTDSFRAEMVTVDTGYKIVAV